MKLLSTAELKLRADNAYPASVGSTIPAQPYISLLKETLARHGKLNWRLLGNSMTPALPPGCTIEVIPLDRQLRLGDIVVFARGDNMIAHRLVRRKNGYWFTQGDARRLPDPPIGHSLLIGRVNSAYLGEQVIWPKSGKSISNWRWVGRYHLLRLVRYMHRLGRRRQYRE